MLKQHALNAKSYEYFQNAKQKQLCLCVHLVCMWCAWCMLRWYVARHGEAQLGKVCKTHIQGSKYVKQIQSRVNPNTGTHLSPNKLKNATWAFFQTFGMQHYTTHMGNAWTYENMPKYKLKLLQRAKHIYNQDKWGTTQSRFWNFFVQNQLVASFSRKYLWRSFWITTQKCILKKNIKHESIKTLSKTYKILKILFGFNRQAIEHTHHIWSCTIIQMK